MTKDISSGDLFIPVDSNRLGDAVKVFETEGDEVKFFPLGGGMQLRCPISDFVKNFKPLPEKVYRKLKEEWTPGKFMIGDQTEDLEYLICDGYTNGETWNGWQQPMFELDAVNKMIEDGEFLDGTGSSGMLAWVEDNALYIVFANENEPLEENDKAALKAGIDEVGDRKVLEEFTRDGVLIEVEGWCCRPQIIKTPEGAKVCYDVCGGSYCWDRVEEPKSTAAMSV